MASKDKKDKGDGEGSEVPAPYASREIGPVVSAAHLASGALPALSELEYAMTLTSNAMQRWTVLAATASGLPGLTPMDVQVLHSVHHRDRPKSLSELCMMLHIEDTHLVNYAIKKLESLNLLSTGKRGKEKIAKISPSGASACQQYHKIREALLIESIKTLGLDVKEISRAAQLLRILSGQYDQAARSAASL